MCLQAEHLICAPSMGLGKAEVFVVTHAVSGRLHCCSIASVGHCSVNCLRWAGYMCFPASSLIFSFNSIKVNLEQLSWLRFFSVWQWPTAAAKSKVWECGRRVVLIPLNAPTATCGVSETRATLCLGSLQGMSSPSSFSRSEIMQISSSYSNLWQSSTSLLQMWTASSCFQACCLLISINVPKFSYYGQQTPFSPYCPCLLSFHRRLLCPPPQLSPP